MCKDCASLPIEDWSERDRLLFHERVAADAFSAELLARNVKCLAASTQAGGSPPWKAILGSSNTHRPEALNQPIEERICESNVAVFVAAMRGSLMGSTLLVA